jgi:hypothetical protein
MKRNIQLENRLKKLKRERRIKDFWFEFLLFSSIIVIVVSLIVRICILVKYNQSFCNIPNVNYYSNIPPNTINFNGLPGIIIN